MPVVPITGTDVMSRIEELTARGVIAKPLGPERAKSSDRELPRADSPNTPRIRLST